MATSNPARPASPPAIDAAPAAGRAAATLLAALSGFFVVTLDAVIVNVALPAMRAELGGGITGLQWVVDGYTLTFAAFLLSAGTLTDRIGAKRAFGWGVGVFVAGSVACGVAPGLGMLVAFRFVQGAAAAVVMPSSMALIGQAYPDSVTRARAVAVWAMGGAVASSAGPVLGGLLTLASWRWIFLVNLPVGAVALLLLARTRRSTRRSARRRVPFDWAGQVTGAAGMAAVVFGAIEAGRAGFTDPRVVVAFTLAGLTLAAFVVVEARVKHPMVPLELLRTPMVVATVVIGFAFMVGYYGMPFVISLVLQQHGLSALGTGVAFLPMMLVGLVLTPLVPRLVERTGARPVVVTGLILMTLGLAAVALAPVGAPIWVTAALMVLVGLGGPTVIPPVIAVLLSTVPGRWAGTASGVLNTSRQLGGALAVAVFGALLAAPPGMPAGMRVSLLVAAVVAAAAAIIAVAGLRTGHQNEIRYEICKRQSRKDKVVTDKTRQDNGREPSGAAKMFGDFAPGLVHFTDDVLFGEVWKRTELTPKQRSLVTVAALATNGNTEQLGYHLGLAKQNGNTEAELIEAITHLAFYAGWPQAMAAMAVAKQVFTAAPS